ncbi:hypothetical protein GCM10027289_15480 [Tsukamurella serpentis]
MRAGVPEPAVVGHRDEPVDDQIVGREIQWAGVLGPHPLDGHGDPLVLGEVRQTQVDHLGGGVDGRVDALHRGAGLIDVDAQVRGDELIGGLAGSRTQHLHVERPTDVDVLSDGVGDVGGHLLTEPHSVLRARQ